MNEPTTVRVEQPVYGAQQLVARAPYEFRFKLADIPGAKWSSPKKAWTYPVSPTTAVYLAGLLGEAAFQADAAAMALLNSGRSSHQVSASKVAASAKAGDLEPLPFEVVTQPWAHQLGMVRFTEPLPAALWNVGLGAGKSRATLDLIRLRKHAKTLIVAPLSVVPSWAEQVRRHAPGAVRIVTLNEGSTASRAKKAAEAWARGTPEMPSIVVTNYACAYTLVFLHAMSAAKLDFMVCDEVHAIKAPQGKQSIALSRAAAGIPYRLGLSGTPLPNSPMDGYGVFRFLDPGVFGKSYVAFRTRFARMGGFQGKQVMGYQNIDEFSRRIAPFTYEVDRSVLDLPPFTHIERVFTLNPEAAAFYNELKNDLISTINEGVVTATNALTKLLRLSQVASGHVGMDIDPVDFDENGTAPERKITEIHTQKQQLLREVLEEIDPKEPVVIFTRFKYDMTQVRTACEGLGEVAELSGSVKELEKWQKPDGPRFLAVQIQSGAEGIDLTRSAYSVYFSKDFSRSRYIQSLARSHRPGQHKAVTYVHLIAENTVDRLIMKAMEKKGKLVDEVLDEIRKWS